MMYTPPPRDSKQPPVRINLLSDTQTRPTPDMRAAVARAEVGDEQIGDDPTVNLLCERVADLLGKEAAVFMPSGTMCNVAATLAYCRPGDEILAHETAHILAREGGAHAALGGFQITALTGADGQFTPDTFQSALHPRTRYQPPQTVVSVEQTANIGGGTIWKKADLDAIVQIAKSNGLATHMDGARLLNASSPPASPRATWPRDGIRLGSISRRAWAHLLAPSSPARAISSTTSGAGSNA
jgi:threonine aldolase